MALNSPDIKIELFLNDARDAIYLEDLTGQYSADNTGGYGLPGGPTSNSVEQVTVTLTYTQLSQDLVYAFTVTTGTITGATISFAGATPTNILSELTSTIWPFTSANRFNLTDGYGITLPTLDDMVYECSYQVEGTYTGEDFDYTADTVDLYDVNTVCCVSKKSTQADLNCLEPDNRLLKIYGWLYAAHAAVEQENTTKANNYINHAKALCGELESCGCSS